MTTKEESMEPTIEDGILTVMELGHDQPSYIKVTSIDGIHHRDADTCWFRYGGGAMGVHGSAAIGDSVPTGYRVGRAAIGPWEQDGAGWVRRYEDFDVAVARVRELYHGCWSWECGLGEDGHGLCATLAEAMAAVDAVLISRGQVSS